MAVSKPDTRGGQLTTLELTDLPTEAKFSLLQEQWLCYSGRAHASCSSGQGFKTDPGLFSKNMLNCAASYERTFMHT